LGGEKDHSTRGEKSSGEGMKEEAKERPSKMELEGRLIW